MASPYAFDISHGNGNDGLHFRADLDYAACGGNDGWGDALMHIVVMVLGVVAGLGFWWYRLNAARDAAGEVIDMAGRVRGSIRRKKIRKQNELSPLTAIMTQWWLRPLSH